MESPVIRAIDVGYGNTKYVKEVDENGKIICDMFPSIAVQYSGKEVDLMDKRDSLLVEADGLTFEIGKDAGINRRVKTNRVLIEDYTKTAAYLALSRGALSMMNVSCIDLLVVGLPVEYVSSKTEGLIDRLTGLHESKHGNSVLVKQVWVLPQPIGGFTNYSLTSVRFNELSDKINLLIDVGYFTVDWMVAKGLKHIDERSGSIELGMSAALRKIAASISDKYKIPYKDFDAIDDAITTTGQLFIDGEWVTISDHMPAAESVITEAMDQLMSTVGDFRDIYNVILVGGGATLFEQGVQKIFKKDIIVKTNDSVFANVLGFQKMGMSKGLSLMKDGRKLA